MKDLKVFWRGIFDENPTFRLLLGMCPTLAVSIAAGQGFGMGLAATAVLVASNILISLLRSVIPDKIRIPCYIVVIATFVTIVDLVMAAFVPALHEVLGIFIPLIVVNCIILQRAEAFASKNGVWRSTLDGLGMGLGFTLALVLVSSIREILGSGTFFGLEVLGFWHSFEPMGIMVSPPGAFIVLGLLLGLINWLSLRKGVGA